MKLNVDSVPSGIVPGAGEDGHGWRFFFVGESEDLIAFLYFLVSTFMQNLVHLSVIFFNFSGPICNMYPSVAINGIQALRGPSFVKKRLNYYCIEIVSLK